jgi:endonuclease YncB( thermonuclease family)
MYEYSANVQKVIDGDTVALLIDLGLDTHRYLDRARLDGLDAPEIGTPAGAASFSALREKIEGRDVIAHTVKLKRSAGEAKEKWGRYLVRLTTLAGEDVNAWLISSGLAKNYHGEAKTGAAPAAPARDSAT